MSAPEGREDAFARQCSRLVAPEVADACFVPKRETYQKRQGAWHIAETPLFASYFFVATRHPRACAKALEASSLPVEPAARTEGGWQPLSAQAQEWLEGALDGSYVLRASEGRIEDGALTVERGPLAGSEALVRKVDRHKRLAFVGIDEGGEGFLVKAALNVPVKR